MRISYALQLIVFSSLYDFILDKQIFITNRIR